MFNSSKSSLNAIHKLTPPKKGKQELIVQVNIGRKGQSKSIRLCDIHNMNNIQQQIKWFIKNNGLKQTAFSYIKEIIVKQINLRKDQIYYQCHSKCTLNCKCSSKIHKFEQKEKGIVDILSASDYSRKSISKGMMVIRQPQHLQIKITPKMDSTRNHQEISSFVFNSSFTLPSSTGQRQRCFLTDQLFQNVLETSQNKSSAYFSSMSQFKSKQRQQQNKIIVNNHNFDMKKTSNNDIVKPLQTSFNKNSTVRINTITTPIKIKPKQSMDKKAKVQCITPLPNKKVKTMSTKQRKAALMTPQQPKACETPIPNLIHLNSENLEHMVMQHKKALKQTHYKSINNRDFEPIFPQRCIPLAFQNVLQSLFEKLTSNNPPQIKQINSQFVSYQLLQREQLDFMGILFEKIDHKQLNNLHYINFRCNSLKHCWKQLQDLVNKNSNI